MVSKDLILWIFKLGDKNQPTTSKIDPSLNVKIFYIKPFYESTDDGNI